MEEILDPKKPWNIACAAWGIHLKKESAKPTACNRVVFAAAPRERLGSWQKPVPTASEGSIGTVFAPSCHLPLTRKNP